MELWLVDDLSESQRSKPTGNGKGKGKGKGKRKGRANGREEPRVEFPYPKLAYGFDIDIHDYKKVKSLWGGAYHIGLYGRLGIQCYNLQMGTNHKFLLWEKYSTALNANFDNYITLEANDPVRDSIFSFQTLFSEAWSTDGIDLTWRTLASRIQCCQPVDDEFDMDASIDAFYKDGSLKWLSDEALATDHKKYYVVQESELRDDDWLQLLMEVGFFSKADCRVTATPPLEIKKVVIETNDDYVTDAHEKLKVKDAIFYISYKCNDDPSKSVWAGDHKTIVRKTMDGKPGHMCLEVAELKE